MSADVPRRASFDDLRVGQKVVYLTHHDEGKAGFLVGGHVFKRKCSDVGPDESDYVEIEEYKVTREDEQRGDFTILRDAPVPPVKVRREDYDALVDWFTRIPTDERHELWSILRALIDNADVGDAR